MIEPVHNSTEVIIFPGFHKMTRGGGDIFSDERAAQIVDGKKPTAALLSIRLVSPSSRPLSFVDHILAVESVREVGKHVRTNHSEDLQFYGVPLQLLIMVLSQNQRIRSPPTFLFFLRSLKTFA